MKPSYKKGLITIGIYAALIATGALLSEVSPGGPCAPGGGALFFMMVFPFVALVLFLKDSYHIIRGDKDVYFSMALHLLILTVILIGI